MALGSPIWVPLGIAAAMVIAAVYISLWSVVVPLWAGFASLVAGAAGGAAAAFAVGGRNGLCGAFCVPVLRMPGGDKGNADPPEENRAVDEKPSDEEGGNAMKKTTKIWLITAGALMLAGCILFAGVMSTLKWDFTKLSTVNYETNTYELSDTFRDISIITDTADISFALSDNGKCTVECREQEHATHAVTVEGDALVIRINDRRTWDDYIGIFLDAPRITVCLPEAQYRALSIHGSTGKAAIPGDFTFESAEITLTTGSVAYRASTSEAVQIKTTTGSIRAENLSAGSLALSVTTGAVTASDVTCEGNFTVDVSTGGTHLTGVSCQSLISKGTMGSISLNNVIAAGSFSLERTTDTVKFNGCDAAEMSVKTTTGSITGSLLSAKVFLTDTATGSVDVPKTVTGGRCELKTGTGNIKMKID